MGSHVEEFSQGWKEEFLLELCKRPKYMTEVRRDGKDDQLIASLIKEELEWSLEKRDEHQARVMQRSHLPPSIKATVKICLEFYP